MHADCTIELPFTVKGKSLFMRAPRIACARQLSVRFEILEEGFLVNGFSLPLTLNEIRETQATRGSPVACALID